MLNNLHDAKIAIIGLGYVGLPLALAFAEHFATVGYDISQKRIDELRAGKDHTLETAEHQIEQSLQKKNLNFTDNLAEISDCNVYIVTVPTPIDSSRNPDLSYLKKATEAIAGHLKTGDVVIYESTTYPGCTEEFCVPLLEEISKLKHNKDFYTGYSPERINPGDKKNTLKNIKKVTSGSNVEAAEFVDDLYQKIIEAGTFKTSSIKVAEASKAVENAQRDINISFVNELAVIFEKLGIDTNEVLDAAATKWNFMNFRPGLVGGHCIGVDPYYLAYKAEKAGYSPDIILSGRRVNDNMPNFIVNKVVKMMVARDIPVKGSKTLVLGFTFKENCPDIRNTKVAEVYRELVDFGSEVTIFDPWAAADEVLEHYGIAIKSDFSEIEHKSFDAIILATAHSDFKQINLKKLRKELSLVYDCKGFFDRHEVDARL